MKVSRFFAALLLTPLFASAEDVAYSPPVGGMTISVPAGQTRAISLPLVNDSFGNGNLVGKLTAVGTNYVESSTASWTAGAFSNSSVPYYLRVKTGSAAGRIMPVASTANTDSRVYLSNDGIDLLQSGVASGDVYELILADTLESLFGDAGLFGGIDYLSADNVQVWSGADWLVFYRNTLRSRWELKGDTAASPSRNNYVLRPDRGLLVTRRGAGELKFHVTGKVPNVSPRLAHSRPGVTFLSTGLPININLGSLALQNKAVGWNGWSTGSAANSNADLIQVWSGADWLVFYFNTTRQRWELNTDSAGSPSRDAYVLQAGRPIMIKRLGTAANTADRLLEISLPYAL